ncbi:hypothetical protein PBY51_012138 [Eleginops maclovinus]|uniref:Uncharacterized protein n=1 Tax=Eleginops maclovinus TaxID=56733 RepID=A0AAN7XVC3_ELEMC|nr:hypothetical protein PBY51_012138 [Eleginops maclovinus]
MHICRLKDGFDITTSRRCCYIMREGKRAEVICTQDNDAHQYVTRFQSDRRWAFCLNEERYVRSLVSYMLPCRAVCCP